MSRLRDELLLTVSAALVAAFLALLDLPGVARLTIGLLAVFVLPGYALSLALLPRPRLESIERLVIAVALSLALIVAIAPLLDITAGITSTAVIGAVTGITIVSVGVAAWRRSRERGTPADRDWRVFGLQPSRWPTMPVFWLIVLAVTAAVLLILNSRAAPFTEFFVLGESGYADTYPRRVEVGEPTTIRVGITNQEGGTSAYRVVASTNSRVVATQDGIVVQTGQTWTGDLTFVLVEPGPRQPLAIELLKGDDGDPYRSLRLWIDVLPGT